MSAILKPPLLASTMSVSSRSRYKQAYRHLKEIRDNFGEKAYYICLFGSSITVLATPTDTSGFDAAFKQWLCTAESKLPHNFLTQAAEIVQKHLQSEASSHKRSHTVPDAIEPEITLKKPRCNESYDAISTGQTTQDISLNGPLKTGTIILNPDADHDNDPVAVLNTTTKSVPNLEAYDHSFSMDRTLGAIVEGYSSQASSLTYGAALNVPSIKSTANHGHDMPIGFESRIDKIINFQRNYPDDENYNDYDDDEGEVIHPLISQDEGMKIQCLRSSSDLTFCSFT